ncbi:rhodanese homology domain-containing protein [Rhizobium sp. LCM 4573]|uniref:rhodanese homology domain-containing protein n=1 Tax=Rhizobium sp. LCM 4573 TaxID=1848291 RepID=UPI0008DB2DF0|nr:rhodanese homology domain-containing protein [Rhizobium sp. LCM 4573]OHV77057.1 sulfurtransferase [Rhizobium sp. LCM 4573]
MNQILSSPAGVSPAFPTLSPAQVRAELLARREILLADLREEDPFAKGHPLWAANFPFGKLELDALRRIPRRDVLIVLYGKDEYRDLAPLAALKLAGWGYGNVHLLEGGLAAWEEAGYETFIDVNVPSKSFGELVEARRHTPLLPAEEVQRLIESDTPPVILDARRFDEFNTMSIPTGTSVPGAELVLRVRDLAPDPKTTVIVNCAGRTRSIIGTQSLINAGIPNPVFGLRNGTIGWTLAGLTLDQGATRHSPEISPYARTLAQADARAVAERAGIRRISLREAEGLASPDRTVYRIDVRSSEEYQRGHLPGFVNVPGGQLVQETDHTAPVRGALILLSDDDGTRADMTASWLSQMGWEVYVIAPVDDSQRSQRDNERADTIPAPSAAAVSPDVLRKWLAGGDTIVVDVGSSANYVKGHIPGAWWALRSQLEHALNTIGTAKRIVVTCASGTLAKFAAADIRELTSCEVYVLEGGTVSWLAKGLPVIKGEERLASPRIDRYRRPYEGTDAPRQAMEDYLEWEYGLVAQLDRDGTHFFRVI